MTCIIGLEENGRAYIGGDSAAASGWEVRAIASPKIFTRGQFVIGYTSSFRMGQILQYQVEFPPSDTYDRAYMVSQFAEAVRLKFKELGYSKIEGNREEGGTFIVGVKGKIYTIESDFQVMRFADGMDACGAGREYALGAMLALADLPPMQRIEKALEISAHYSGGVIPPFVIVEVPNE